MVSVTCTKSTTCIRVSACSRRLDTEIATYSQKQHDARAAKAKRSRSSFLFWASDKKPSGVCCATFDLQVAEDWVPFKKLSVVHLSLATKVSLYLVVLPEEAECELFWKTRNKVREKEGETDSGLYLSHYLLLFFFYSWFYLEWKKSMKKISRLAAVSGRVNTSKAAAG